MPHGPACQLEELHGARTAWDGKKIDDAMNFRSIKSN